MWDPAAYLRFDDERSRPFADLLARVGADQPRAVIDLGCGPGTLTATLAARWPRARVRGIDSSPEMITKARATGGSRARAADGVPVEFVVADVRDWLPEPDVDVVVSNAVLQWVPGHLDLLPRWVAALPAGAWLALQVPGNFDAPSHRAMREVAADPRWRDRMPEEIGPREMPAATGYAALLTAAGCAVDAWETTYVHQLPAGDGHPVLRWMEGTALRPVRAALGDGPDWAAFRAALADRLAVVYPAAGNLVYFPFRRIFAVALLQSRPRSSRPRSMSQTTGEP